MKVSIDLSKNDPYGKNNRGWVVEQQSGTLELDLNQIQLWKAPDGEYPGGFYLEGLLEKSGIKSLSAAVAFFLVRNQHLIPKEWESLNCIYFFGTSMTDEDLAPQVVAMSQRDIECPEGYRRGEWICNYISVASTTMGSDDRVAF